MKNNEYQILYDKMMKQLKSIKISKWKDIDKFLTSIGNDSQPIEPFTQEQFFSLLCKGVAFVTYDFGIDGVSIEISKYAKSLESLFSNTEKPSIHFIGGDFYTQADSVLESDWNRYKIDGANGWSKWENGKWFAKLFYKTMKEKNKNSDEVATEIWKQAVSFSEKLGKYLVDNNISLMIPVNVCSNPGNMSFGLSVILVSELMGIYVLNSNHDFYWEGGKPSSKRKKSEAKGPRDHFFKNRKNHPFFALFMKIYPWNGRRWLQVNINSLQSKHMIKKLGFHRDRVFELSTSVSDEFFREYSKEEIKSVRLRMAYILSDGKPIINPVPVKDFQKNLKKWMLNERPVVCGAKEGLSLDLTSDKIFYFLQPTRVIARKRIERDEELIRALLNYKPFFKKFEKDKERKIVLHITGPTPMEHRLDLEKVIKSFMKVISEVPDSVSSRLFLALSVGNEEHPIFKEKKFKKLTIEDIYRLATVILFPSETEGRGLPIIEASASGIPIICSRYTPEKVFMDVVGEKYPDVIKVRYINFPENKFSKYFLGNITKLLFNPESYQTHKEHNQYATHIRYSADVLKRTFDELLSEFLNIK
ncbi:MAG: glycosyltransferase [Bacteroidetes bacterium]|nr:glycosyltransferase [Bacteroidota bacterium]